MSDQTDRPGPQDPSTLDGLYGALAGAQGAQEDLDQQDRQALQDIASHEQRLQEERRESEGRQDTEACARIDAQLEDLREAYLTITDRLEDDDSPHESDDQDEPGGGG